MASREDIKKMFPHLYEELQSGEVKISINAVRKNATKAEAYADGIDYVECDENHEGSHESSVQPRLPKQNRMPDKLRHFNPQAVDFLRRCDTKEQAEEIIAYLEKKGEITKAYACELRSQLEKDGVRVFGPKKEENHYFKEAGIL